MKEYMIVFSSYYMALYAQEKLQQAQIQSSLKRVPADLLKSCGYALILKVENIEHTKEALRRSEIEWRTIYLIEKINHKVNYRVM